MFKKFFKRRVNYKKFKSKVDKQEWEDEGTLASPSATESASPSCDPPESFVGIYRFVDISTAHITKRDRIKLLQMTENSWVSVIQHECGHIVRVPQEWNEAVTNLSDNDEMSPEFIQIMNYANYYGCWFVNFDRDGTKFENFTVFV